MRLLDGRDTVTLFPLLEGRDVYEMPVHEYTEPITVACSPQWQTPAQNPSLGLDHHTRVVVLARTWIGTPQSRFWWRGCTFEQVGHAKYLYGSRRTSHYEIQADLIAEEEQDPRTATEETEPQPDEGESQW